VKENKKEAAAKVEQEKKKAEKEAAFQAMTPEQHLAAVQTMPASDFAKRHMEKIPDGFPGKSAVLARWNKAADEAKAEQKRLQAEKDAKEAAELKKQLAQWRKEGVKIGMTKERVLLSSWGRPEKVNTTHLANGSVHEQWVYGGGYLYFDDGILTTIQN
jgi:hypothetical protein